VEGVPISATEIILNIRNDLYRVKLATVVYKVSIIEASLCQTSHILPEFFTQALHNNFSLLLYVNTLTSTDYTKLKGQIKYGERLFPLSSALLSKTYGWTKYRIIAVLFF
jgi:ABC-type uncharacterized transport system involved in gliding motility auxiliary subunit